MALTDSPDGPRSPPPPSATSQLAFWRRVRRLTRGLLVVWALAALVAPWYAAELNRWTVAGFPLGFWLCAEGAILVFVGIIAVYAWVMDRWEAAWWAAEPGAAAARAHG